MKPLKNKTTIQITNLSRILTYNTEYRTINQNHHEIPIWNIIINFKPLQ